MSTYRYSRIEGSTQFRLLRVTWDRNKPINTISMSDCEFSLVSFMLDQAPPYYALSYTWGPPSTPGQSPVIMVPDGAIPVTATLYAALSRICPRRWGQYIWIDQICIDQANLAEKNEQVPLMRRIYTESSEVFVWLGDDEEMASHLAPLAIGVQAFAFGPLCPPSILTHPDDVQMGRQQTIQRLTGLLDFLASEDETDSAHQSGRHQRMRALKGLLNLPWFCRGWVFQEFVNQGRGAVKFFLGNWVWPVQNFFGMVFGSDEAERLFFQQGPRLGDISAQEGFIAFQLMVLKLDELSGMRTAMTLPHFLAKLTDVSIVANPRDYVYAFLGLWGEAVRFIKPDYRLTATEVFVDGARGLLAASSSLDILGFCSGVGAGYHLKPGVPENLPSWVPRWGAALRKNAIAGNYSTESFCASGSYTHQESAIDKNPFHLVVRGRRLGQIDKIIRQFGSNFQRDPDALRNFLNLDEICREVAPLVEEAFGRESLSLKTRLFRVMLADGKRPVSQDGDDGKVLLKPASLDLARLLRAFDLSRLMSEVQTAEMQLQALKSMPRGDLEEMMLGILSPMTAALTSNNVSAEDLSELWKDFGSMYWQALLAVERSIAVGCVGTMGLVDSESKPGDVVCILYGSKTPVVLREAERGYFKVVGQCYWEGVMYGEGVSRGELDAENFILV